MKLSHREQFLLCLLVWVAAIYWFCNYVYIPQNNSIAAWSNKNGHLQQQLSSAQNTKKSLAEIDSRKQLEQLRFNTLVQQVPTSAYVPEIIAFVEKSAVKSGIKLVKVNYNDQNGNQNNKSQSQTQGGNNQGSNNKADVTPAGVKSLDFDITASGSYYNLTVFIGMLEQAPRLYNLSNINLTEGQYQNQSAAVSTPAVQTPGAAASAGDAAGAEPTASTVPTVPVLKGSAKYDPANITLTLTMEAYYSNKKFPGLQDIEQKLEPAPSERDNPFRG